MTSNPAGIDCGSNCVATFSLGTTVSLTANPSTGYKFDGWGGACTGGSTCRLTLNSPEAITARFSPISAYYLLSVSNNGTGSIVSDPPGILCTGGCSATYLSGTLVTLYPTAASGAYFTGWSGACTGLGVCTVNMTGNLSVVANYDSYPTVTSNIYVTKSGNGIVTSSPAGINCGSNCTFPFPNNTLVTLYATPDSGHTFTGWSGACTGKSSCMVIMSANQSVAATFKSNYLMILPILNDYLNR